MATTQILSDYSEFSSRIRRSKRSELNSAAVMMRELGLADESDFSEYNSGSNKRKLDLDEHSTMNSVINSRIAKRVVIENDSDSASSNVGKKLLTVDDNINLNSFNWSNLSKNHPLSRLSHADETNLKKIKFVNDSVDESNPSSLRTQFLMNTIFDGDINLENADSEQSKSSPSKNKLLNKAFEDEGHMEYYNSTGESGSFVNETNSKDENDVDEQTGSGYTKLDGVGTLLYDLGLDSYLPLFRRHGVDENVLPLLTLEDLKDIGIEEVGYRRKMYCAIKDLGQDVSSL